MAIVHSVKESFPGYGQPSNYGAVIADVLSGTATITIPATGATTPAGGTAFNTSGGPPPTRGRFKFRALAVNAATTIAFVVTVTDGTTTLQVDSYPTTAAGTFIDYTGEFNTDLNITSVSIVITIAGATQAATVDFEVALT